MDLPVRMQIENTVQIVRDKVEVLPDDLTVWVLAAAACYKCTQPETTIVEPALAGDKLLFNISIINEVQELRRLRREIENTLTGTPAQEIIMSVNLAVDEATQNIIRHAFPDDMSKRIDISGYIEGDCRISAWSIRRY